MEAYDWLYLNDNIKITRFLFHKFIQSGRDFFGCVQEYMEHSEIRAKMDEGNWGALNKGINQVYNSVNLDNVPLSQDGNEYMDGILSDWIADIYVFLQWKYCITSAKIVQILPPAKLCEFYNPLSEASVSNACEKLYSRYFGKKEEK